MATRIKLKRGTGSPAGSLEQYEVAMDQAAQILYTSTNGSDAVILANKYDDVDAVSAINNGSVDLQNDARMRGEVRFDDALNHANFMHTTIAGTAPAFWVEDAIQFPGPTAGLNNNVALVRAAKITTTDGEKYLGDTRWRNRTDSSSSHYDIRHYNADGSTIERMASFQYGNAIYFNCEGDIGDNAQLTIQPDNTVIKTPLNVVIPDNDGSGGGYFNGATFTMLMDNSADNFTNPFRAKIQNETGAMTDGTVNNVALQWEDNTTSGLPYQLGAFEGIYHSSGKHEFSLIVNSGVNSGDQTSQQVLNATVDRARFNMPVRFENVTTTQRDALSPEAGWAIFNTTTSKLEVYDGSTWQAAW